LCRVLCVVSHKRFLDNGRVFWTTGGFLRHIKCLAELYDRILLAVPVVKNPGEVGGTVLDLPNCDVHPLPDFPYPWVHNWFLSRDLKRRLAQAMADADVVHIMGPNFLMFTADRIARRLAKPTFVYMAGKFTGMAIQKNPLKRIIGRAVSGLLEWRLRGVLHGRLAYLAGSELYRCYGPMAGRALETLTGNVEQSEMAGEPAGGCSERPVFLYVGRLDMRKGLGEFVRAAADLVRQGESFSLRFVGDGHGLREVEELAAKWLPPDQISFAGYVPMGPGLWDEYRCADVFVLPSLAEGMPKVVGEAMAQGLPVISTDVGGVRRIFNDPENGLIVPPGDVAALSAAMRQMLRLGPDGRRHLGATNLKRARTLTRDARREFLRQTLNEEGLLGPGAAQGSETPTRKTCRR